MKKIYLTIIALAIFILSCEKNSDNGENIIEDNLNSKYLKTGDPYDYVFINPKWELISDKYEDEFGNIGKMYVNTNNLKEYHFEIYSFRNENKSNQILIKGIKKISFELCADGTFATRTKCERATENQNCQICVSLDDNGEILKVEFQEILDSKLSKKP